MRCTIGGWVLAVLLATSGCGDDADTSGAGMAAPAVAEWSACFAPSADADSCDEYCALQGLGCASTCSTGTQTASDQQASALAWDGPGCTCGNPRCPAADRATGTGRACSAPGFVTSGDALPRTSIRCCCQAGAPDARSPVCDDLTTGMWIKQPAPADMCSIDGLAGHEELNFEAAHGDVAAWVVRWACDAGEIRPRSWLVYELYEDGCSGTLGGAIYFMLVGDTLTVEWGGSGGSREYKHAPAAPKRPGNPALGT